VPVLHVRLDHEEVEIALGIGITGGMRAEQDNSSLGRGVG